MRSMKIASLYATLAIGLGSLAALPAWATKPDPSDGAEQAAGDNQPAAQADAQAAPQGDPYTILVPFALGQPAAHIQAIQAWVDENGEDLDLSGEAEGRLETVMAAWIVTHPGNVVPDAIAQAFLAVLANVPLDQVATWLASYQVN